LDDDDDDDDDVIDDYDDLATINMIFFIYKSTSQCGVKILPGMSTHTLTLYY